MASEAEIYEALAGIFRETFMRDDIQLRPELSAKDVDGWDSLKQVMLMVGAEQRFGIRFSTREMDGMRCVGDLVRIIMAKAG